MSARFAFVTSLALLAASALPAAPAAVLFDGNWKVQRFSLFGGNEYGFQGDRLTLRSDGTVSIAYRPLSETAWGATAARWSWTVEEGVPATDLTKKGGDDRNLALYFVFLPDGEAQRLRGAAITQLLREDSVRALVYVWGGDHARGEVLPSPYLGARGKTVVLRGAETGRHAERVDLVADYRRAFGGTPEALVGIAVSGDSDDTDSAIRAAIDGLRIE